jgi:PAS domain S-box-containing protein
MAESLQSALGWMTVFRSSSDAYLTFAKADGRILSFNPAAEQLFGHHGTDIFGQPIGMLFTPRAAGQPGELPPEAYGGTPCEAGGCKADGTDFPVEVVLTQTILADTPVYVACVRDVSDRKRAEESVRDSEAGFRAALEALGEGVVIADEQDQIVYVNSRMAHLTDYSMEEMLGQSVSELLVPEEDAEPYRARSEMLLQGFSEQVEALVKRKGGERFWAEINATPFRDPHGEVIGTLSAIIDITERKRIQEELVRAIDDSEDANRAKSTFLANMSHELRTPMNAILGYNELLQEEAQERGLTELLPDLEKIQQAGRHLLRLINDILDLSKIEAKKIELHIESFEVDALIGDVVGTMQHLVARHGNRLEVRRGDELGSMRADLTRVRQVLLNLLGNAAKFTENGTITLDVGRAVERGRTWIRFIVKDTGIGMSPEQVSKLFQAFTQVDASPTRKYEGTGLGLVISRQLCRIMGGDVTVESQLGKGSTFVIRIPANVEGPRTTTLTPVKSRPTVSPSKGPPLVLVVEDDRHAFDLLGRFLAKEGLRVAAAATGAEALEQARRLKPQLITLDLVLPDRSGYEVLQELQADPDLSQIPVFVISMVDDESRGLAMGAVEYMTKPINWRRLSDALRKHLGDETLAPASSR